MFGDEFGLSFSEPIGFTWAPRGQTPVLKRIGRYRRELSTFAALTISGRVYKKHFAGSINSEKVILALDHLRRHLGGPFIDRKSVV